MSCVVPGRQVVASEIGATVTGIDGGNLRHYLLELTQAAAAGALQPPKFSVGLRACGVFLDDKTPVLLSDLLWCAPPHRGSLPLTHLGLPLGHHELYCPCGQGNNS